MNRRRMLISIFPLLLLSGCASASSKQWLASATPEKAGDITGRWLQPAQGTSLRQGFELLLDGRARSVNMATLRIEKWEQRGNTLVLMGKSIDNGQITPFNEAWAIETVTNRRLVLRKGDMVESYRRA
jgi:hypothetical protein